MRTKVIAGNWKMNKDIDDSIELVNGIKNLASGLPSGVKVIVCPPFTSLVVVHRLLQGTSIALGAQNMHTDDEGAFTGEISPKMLKSAGCRYVIVGHSERRQLFGETNDLINRKARKALSAGLVPIICVGETLEEREKGITEKVISVQVKGVLKELPAADVEKCIIAYEPVWAIGTGKTATPDQAVEVHQLIRKLIGQLHSWAVAEKVVIQYGGSVKPENAPTLLTKADIDGALVGGACLKADSFAQIIKSAVSS